MDEVRSQLRRAAAAHQPDRARMLARVQRGMFSSAATDTTALDPVGSRTARHRNRIALSWPKVALTTLATAATLAVGGFAVGAVVRSHEPRQGSAVGGPETPRSPSPAASSPRAAGPRQPGPSTPPPTGTGRPSAPSTGPGSGHPSAAPPSGPRTEDGPLWADGSVDPHSNSFWAQSNVTLKTRTTLTALSVELRIAQTGGVHNAGAWRTLPADDFALSVRADGDVLVYRWTLKAGRTVPAGQHVFAGQYDHTAGGRDARADSYRVNAVTADGKPAVWGHFARSS
ncbi:hypothetical protein [Streptomyces sp. H39-S7]|uniref:hypothetical protein n=1 Tax=Streptomyces sp. H39-S7 TaxID=3004357 RepID=UPI0022AFAADD|nr:hypothetical protein [Streptomyces sp. H39-S7]MCZ4119676.1 hypothetical protein [Streptomyces sp. H39-S7]